jgi:hypothetical protein
MTLININKFTLYPKKTNYYINYSYYYSKNIIGSGTLSLAYNNFFLFSLFI